jgi:hypothetical protein
MASFLLDSPLLFAIFYEQLAILGENNARLYNFTPQQRSALENDRFVQIKGNYKKEGEGLEQPHLRLHPLSLLHSLRKHEGTVFRWYRSAVPLTD